MSASPLTIQLFGPMRVLVDGEPMGRVRTRSVEWLLALLVLRAGRAVDRSWLAGTLWPESEEKAALHNLRNALVSLRKALGSEGERLQSPSRDTLTVDLNGAWVDVLRFDAATESGNENLMVAAISVYTGPLLEGCYEDWLLLERNRRAEQCVCMLESLAEVCQRRTDLAEAIHWLQRAEAMEPTRDSIVQRLMSCLQASGDPAAAGEVYRAFRTRLHEELSASPDPATTELYRSIREQAKSGEIASQSRPRPAVAPQATRTSTIPSSLTPLVGRDDEVRTVSGLLQNHRLVTLTGAGGIGKTRLAMEVTRRWSDEIGDAAFWAELAALANAGLILPAIAAAMGLQDDAGDGQEGVIGRLSLELADRTVLLALDNCEHLTDAVAEVVLQLLTGCPGLTILATSRQRLGLTGEYAWRVPSLGWPEGTQVSGVTAQSSTAGTPTPTLPLGTAEGEGAGGSIYDFPAVRLFIDRAEAAQSGLNWDSPENMEAVCQICRRLDGIPLALELAAARVNVLSLAEIAARLDDRFQLLTSGSRSTAPRQRTLRALIDWSYELLSDEEQDLFQRLSVFSGGWTLAAAEQIQNPTSRIQSTNALDLVASLLDKSLILADESSAGRRYRMLETIREYAGGKLVESGEEASVRNSHLSYFLKVAEEACPALEGPGMEAALSTLRAEIGNLRAALKWAQSESARAEAYVQLVALLWPYWEHCGPVYEGRTELCNALQRATPGGPEHAHLLLGASTLALRQHDEEEIFVRPVECLDAFRALGDPRGTAEALFGMIELARYRGDGPAAKALAAEALNLSRQCGWTRGSAMALQKLGSVAAMEGDGPQALGLLEEGLTLAEETGDPLLIALSLHNVGDQTLAMGDLARTRILLEQALEFHLRLGHRHNTAVNYGKLGRLARRQGDYPRALVQYDEAIAIWREQGNRVSYTCDLQERNCILYERRDYSAAEAAMTETLAMFRQLTMPHWIAYVSNTLGSTKFHLQEYEESGRLHREALAYYQSVDNIEGIAWSLERLAVLEAASGDVHRAARLMGAAGAARKEFGKERDRWDEDDWEEAERSLRSRLAEEELGAELAAGRASTRDVTISLALNAENHTPYNMPHRKIDDRYG